MKIGIIGSGHIGSTLAHDFRRLQHTVLIANSRGPQTLSQIAAETGAIPVSVLKVADHVDLLVVAVPIQSVLSLPKDLLVRLPASVPIIDTTNYYPPVSGQIPEIDGGMVEAEWTSKILGRSVVKVFNSIYAHSLRNGALPRGAKKRIALPVAGDSVEQKQVVMTLIDAIGFDAFDAGSLSDSWRFQPGNPAYCSDPNLQQLPLLLQKADRQKAPRARDEAGKMFGKVLLEHPQGEMVRVLRVAAGIERWNPRNWIAILGLLYAIARFKLGFGL